MIGGYKILIQARTRVTDSQGGFTQTWATVYTERGFVRPASGGERMNGKQLEAAVTHVAYLRAGAVVAVEDHLVCQSHYYRVHAVRNPGGVNKGLEIDCEEVQGG